MFSINQGAKSAAEHSVDSQTVTADLGWNNNKTGSISGWSKWSVKRWTCFLWWGCWLIFLVSQAIKFENWLLELYREKSGSFLLPCSSPARSGEPQPPVSLVLTIATYSVACSLPQLSMFVGWEMVSASTVLWSARSLHCILFYSAKRVVIQCRSYPSDTDSSRSPMVETTQSIYQMVYQ